MSKKKKNKKPTTANTKNLNIFSEQQKAIKFFNNLNFVQRKYVSDYAEMKQVEFQRCFLEHLDCVLTATLATEFEEMSLTEIGKILEIFTDMFTEHVDSKKDERGKGREEIMAKRKELEPKIVKMCEKLLEEGKSQKENIETLRFKFSGISKSELTNCYKRVKEMKSAAKKLKEVEIIECEDPEIKEGLEKIFKDEKDVKFEVKKDIKAEIKKALVKEDKKVVKIAEKEAVISRKEEVKELVEKVSKLKIIKHEVVAEGIYGQYIKNENGVKHGITVWKTVEELREKTTEKIKEKKRLIEQLEKEIDYVAGIALEAEDVFNV